MWQNTGIQRILPTYLSGYSSLQLPIVFSLILSGAWSLINTLVYKIVGNAFHTSACSVSPNPPKYTDA